MKQLTNLRRDDGPKPKGRTSDVLAAALRERILGGEFGAGVLPSERDIVDATGFGRGSVREALRVLSAEGLIRTKAGRNGGTFTTQPDGDRLARFVSLFVRGRRVTMRSLIEARTTLETSLAFYAARNRTAEDITALEEACRLLEETPHGPEFARVNLAWHDAVAAASHNEILCAFLASIATSIARESAAAQEHVLEENATSEMRASVIYAHRRITEAVVAGDPETAKRRMERHLNAFSESIAAATESTEIEIP